MVPLQRSLADVGATLLPHRAKIAPSLHRRSVRRDGLRTYAELCSGSGTFRGKIYGVKSILYYKNYSLLYTMVIAMRLATLWTPFAVGHIRLVIAPLHPGDSLQNLLNRIRAQGQDHFQYHPQLRHRERRCFFFSNRTCRRHRKKWANIVVKIWSRESEKGS